MKYSILYLNENIPSENSVIYDLSIDRSMANISDDRRRNEYFCRVLSKPIMDKDSIEFRREILKDFLGSKELFDSLKTLFNRYDKLKGDWLELKGSGEYSCGDKGSEAMLEYIYSSLKVTALFPNTILSFFESIAETLSSYDIHSRGLCRLRDYARELLENRSLGEIADIASNFMYNTHEDYDFEILVSLGDCLEAYSGMISSVTKREKKKAGLLSMFSSKRKDSAVVENNSENAIEDSRNILGEALYVIDKLLYEVTGSVYSNFYGISAELDFYESAMRYIDYLTEKQITLCYPDFSSDKTEITGLKDLFLITEDKGEVYSNNFGLTGYCGALIKGKNNTGKTTFLRSIATAQLFAQAGLPITAHSAVIPLYSGIYTHFSSAEEEFSVGDTSGRFESEVKAIAEIMDKIDQNSLVIFNESFQTTAYDEGSEAMKNILRAISAIGGRYIFVTHLTDLFDMMGEDTAKFTSADGDTPFTINKL